MDVENMTLKELRQVAAIVSKLGIAPDADASCPWPIGKNVIVRTVTMIQVGKLVRVTPHELVLEDAAWVADMGRFSECLATGVVSECEPFPAGTTLVGRGAVVDACEWKFPLLRVVR